MANTYTQIHLHVVFAVQGRHAAIPEAHAERLYRYITGIITERGQKLLAINGMPNHLHLLIGLRPDMALAELMREVKASSSKFINEQRWVAGKFAWQAGYGAFSYSTSQLPDVIRYIEGQQAHHRKQTFQEEYQSILDRFGIDYDPRYIFSAD
ncbi:MAG TPA: IS200/IS605 family transposase [Hymenobacter sp.]|uniref:IS200/IS605 family transposase n=1 Tax=Hymenobacter sp. TaxID=1898978 RepID=UPI002D80B962|nr:IS200/IS605 family transposase [Hymenobacter sp.]HET9504486.1 IS200/IS605 family transposase [Hymenobacter sp.]